MSVPVDGPVPPSRSLSGQMSLVQHLFELRNRLAKSLIAITIAGIVVFWQWQPVLDFLRQPFCHTKIGRNHCELIAIGIFDQFKVRVRVGFIGGILVASPVWLYQIGAFITPALHRKERRYAGSFLAGSLTFFAIGATLAYLTVDRGLDFLFGVGGTSVGQIVTLQDYLSFVTLCLVAFGIAFEFPVVIMFLHFVGVLSSARMRAMRRGMIMALFVGSAFLTPSQDPITFLAMAVPLCLLYEVCILVARVRERRRRKRSGLPEDLSDDAAAPLDTPASHV